VTDVAKMLHISPEGVRRLVRAGRLRAVRVNSRGGVPGGVRGEERISARALNEFEAGDQPSVLRREKFKVAG
jgi:hypothetical protein